VDTSLSNKRSLTARKPTAPSTPSKFTWFGSSKASSASMRAPAESDDKLINLDVEAALFPYGPVDPLSPSSFHDLLTNAEALIHRLQAAYKEKCEDLRDMEGEESVLEEEIEEADTRARHLKIQLDDMAAKAVEQDKAMKALADELALERLRRREEEDARKRSVSLIQSPASLREITPRALKRESRDSDLGSVDSGFESEGESSAESVFSRENGAASPAGTILSSYSDLDHHVTPNVRNARPPHPLRRSSTFDKVLKTMPHHRSEIEEERWSCANCQGGSQRSAWNTVSTLREQNRQLDVRVKELESTVEGCLDLVSGLGL